MMKKLLITAVLMGGMVSTSAQAADADNLLSTVATYKTALTAAVKEFNTQITSITARVTAVEAIANQNKDDLDDLKACHNDEKLYAPGHASADSGGCIDFP